MDSIFAFVEREPQLKPSSKHFMEFSDLKRVITRDRYLNSLTMLKQKFSNSESKMGKRIEYLLKFLYSPIPNKRVVLIKSVGWISMGKRINVYT